MPRYPRSYIQTTQYHVITQGMNKKYIFKEYEDKKFYIKIMYNESEKNIEIVAYCLMNNHVHMLLKVNNLEK